MYSRLLVLPFQPSSDLIIFNNFTSLRSISQAVLLLSEKCIHFTVHSLDSHYIFIFLSYGNLSLGFYVQIILALRKQKPVLNERANATERST